MKKLYLSIVSLAIMLFYSISIVSHVEAQGGDFGDFPYSGTYVTEEDSVIGGFEFDQEHHVIMIMIQQTDDRYQFERVNRLINSEVNLIDPTISAETIQEMWSEWGIEEINLSGIYLEVAEEVDSSMTPNDVLKLIGQRIPGIHVFSDHTIMLSQAKIKPSQDLWIVGLFGEDRILRFEMNEDTQSITDDYGITYHYVEGNETDE